MTSLWSERHVPEAQRKEIHCGTALFMHVLHRPKLIRQPD
jgi:hypothetical protein